MNYEQLVDEQIKLELDMHGSGIVRFEKNNQRAIEAGAASDTDWNRRLIQHLILPMAQGIRAYIEHYTGKRCQPTRAFTYLRQVTPEQSAYVAIKNILDVLGNDKFDANWLVTTIGRRIEDQVRFAKLEGAAPNYIERVKDNLKKSSSQQYLHQHRVMVHSEGKLKKNAKELLASGKDITDSQRASAEALANLGEWVNWPEADCKHIGAALVNIFERTVTFDGHPIIKRELRSKSGNGTLSFILPTEYVTDWIEWYKEAIGALSPMYAPCVIPPRDWTSPFDGGYHTPEVSSTMRLVKAHSTKHLRRLTPKQMPAVYDCVNNLQRVRWAISERVLATANELVSLGLPYALPSKEKGLIPPCPVPEYLSELRGEQLKAALSFEQWEEFSDWKALARDKYSEEAERVQSWREVTRTLGQANTYVKFDALHFVYTLDFRGRVYCMGSLVSPQGGDLQKALLRFADGMALGEEGFKWFAVHGANEWGWDKAPFGERVANVQTEEFKQMCLDIAADPVTFNDWINADKPWQFLNWCFEYADYLTWVAEGKDGKDFVSYIPCAMDGSCSGIQHYSAMLRDEIGGAAVNLLPSDRPQDIYGAVLKVVMAELEAIADGSQVYDKKIGKLEERQAEELAKELAVEWLRIGPNRNLCKKPVMTLPYGSTQLTCRDHVSAWLKDLQKSENKKAKAEGREPLKVHIFGDKESPMPLMYAESFMTALIWKSIGKVVVAARKGMAYIKAVTSKVAKLNKPLEWTTPTGFIVRQVIWQVHQNRVQTQLLGRVTFVANTKTKDIDYHRMVNSCAPNFVHSMDASHLTLAVNSFFTEGLQSVAVIHDSFGTHAANTGKLRELLSGALVDMYESHDVIKGFLSEVEGGLLEPLDGVIVPTSGKLELARVCESAYAFA